MTTIKILDKVINLRIVKKHLVAAKNAGIDLSKIDMDRPMDSMVFSVDQDPITLLEVLWAMKGSELEALGFTEDTFAEAVDDQVFIELRQKFIGVLSGFFPLIKTVSTLVSQIQSGDLASTVKQTIAEKISTT